MQDIAFLSYCAQILWRLPNKFASNNRFVVILTIDKENKLRYNHQHEQRGCYGLLVHSTFFVLDKGV